MALLRENGHEPEIVDYLNAPPDPEEIRTLLSLLGFSSPRQLLRTGEAVYRELGLGTESGEEKLLSAMSAYPKLIERPIVVHEGRAALGRPPEHVLSLF